MRLVIYLSGQKNRSAAFYRNQDSVAASVQVPRADEAKFIELMQECEVLSEEPDWTGVSVPHVDEGTLGDYASDMADEPGWTPGFWKEVLELLECEASCGYVHIVKGSA
jgi:hypothetical protein